MVTEVYRTVSGVAGGSARGCWRLIKEESRKGVGKAEERLLLKVGND